MLAAVRAGASASGDFGLYAAAPGVILADAPVSSAAAACSGDCGLVQGGKVVALTTEPLVEYRGAALRDGAIALLPLPEQTFERSGLKANFKAPVLFERAFRYDPVAGFLTRWYRLAKLADGRNCVSVALDPALPGLEENAAWACDR